MNDNNIVKKVETFKAGHFAFSLNYDRDKLRNLLVEAKIEFSTIADIPILPNLAARLEEELIRRSIFGTAAIEGNPLSEEAVNKVLTVEEKNKKIEDSAIQILNLKKVYQQIKSTQISSESLKLSEELIRSFHKTITEGCKEEDNYPGHYRNDARQVGDIKHGGIYTPPRILEDIKTLMGGFIEWINSPIVLKEDAAIRAALAHYYLGLIHPFGNGNGRTARAIEAMLLVSSGIKFVPHMLSNYYYKNIDEYFLAFSLSEHSKDYDVTPFLEFFLKGVFSSIKEIKFRIFGFIRTFTLADYYKHLRRIKTITQRQFDFLTLLLEFGGAFTLKDLFEEQKFMVIYRKVSERTARRDLANLQKNKLIVLQDNSYTLNYKILG